MRDEIDSRIWIANHQLFADGVDDLLSRLSTKAERPFQLQERPQLIAMIAAWFLAGTTLTLMI